jgi:hypothetical protein
MQISRTVLITCATVAGLYSMTLRAEVDNEAQAKARAALHEKDPNPQVQAEMPGDSEVVVKARQALREKVAELEQGGPVSNVQPVNPEAVMKARQALRQKLDELEGRTSTKDSEAIAKARQAVRRKLGQPTDGAFEQASRAEAEARRKAQSAAQMDNQKIEATAQMDRRSKRAAARGASEFQPLAAPALPISNEKQEKLADLLIRYKADELTPEQYQQERAQPSADSFKH